MSLTASEFSHITLLMRYDLLNSIIVHLSQKLLASLAETLSPVSCTSGLRFHSGSSAHSCRWRCSHVRNRRNLAIHQVLMFLFSSDTFLFFLVFVLVFSCHVFPATLSHVPFHAFDPMRQAMTRRSQSRLLMLRSSGSGKRLGVSPAAVAVST